MRDTILDASGDLNLQAGGQPFFPSIPLSVRADQPRGTWELTKEGPDTWRRGVYAYVKRGLKYPMFEVYDLPDLNITCERRAVSTVPTQALTMLNNEFMLMQADHFAQARFERSRQATRRRRCKHDVSDRLKPRADPRKRSPGTWRFSRNSGARTRGRRCSHRLSPIWRTWCSI